MHFLLESPEQKLLQTTANRIINRGFATDIADLPQEEQVFFLVWIAEGEVGNGGMHAVCYNSTGDYLRKIPDAFRAVGAIKKGVAFERLMMAFGPVEPSAIRSVRERQHEALSDEAVSQIDALDDLYFQTSEDIDLLLYQWCKSWAQERLGT
jgi:hypothetical protein